MGVNYGRHSAAFAILFATALLPKGAYAQAAPLATDRAAPAKSQDRSSQVADTASSGTTVADIVVTAQRRSESLMNVPLAVSALSGDSLARRGITQLRSLASAIPNLQVNDSTGGAEPNFTLRGVGIGNDYSSNQASPVGVYVDDGYLAFRSTYGAQMFDLERVEVLRGPQGTLFGRNTTGGAINFITQKPALGEDTGYIDIGYGNYNSVHAEGAAEATSADKTLGVRAAISYDRHDGYIDNVDPGRRDLAQADNLRGRISVRFRPSENLDVNLRLFAARDNLVQPGVIALGTGPNGVNPFTGYTRQNLGFFDISSDSPHTNRTRSAGAALTIKLRLNDLFSIQSLTSYDSAKSLFGQDVDGSPIDLLDTRFASTYNEINQELRLIYTGRMIKAQGGVFFGRDSAHIDNQYTIFKFLEALGVPADPTLTHGGATINNAYQQVRISKAVFGQADIEFLPRLTATLGVRYTSDIDKYENGASVIGDYNFNPIVQVIGAPGSPLNRRGTDSAVTGRAALSYRFESGPLIYVSYNRGYRGGTFNGAGYLSPTQITFVRPEEVNAYEAGAKGRFFNGALSVAAAAYYYDYSNQQIQDQVGPVAFLLNAGKSTIKGVELEATARVAAPLIFSASVGYTDAKYDKLTLQNTDLDHNTLPLSPSVTVNARIDYTISDISGGKLVLSPSVTYTSSMWFTPYNTQLGNGPLRQGAYTVFDANIEWRKGPWAVRVWGKNLNNAEYYTYGTNLTSFGIYYFNPNEPRTFGVALRRVF